MTHLRNGQNHAHAKRKSTDINERVVAGEIHKQVGLHTTAKAQVADNSKGHGDQPADARR